jgi:hypothetical protein
MKYIFSTLLLYCCCFCVYGEIKIINHSAKVVVGDNQSFDVGVQYAVKLAKREVLEIAGTYLETFTVVKNNELEHDEIIALSSGVLNTKIISKKRFVEENHFGAEVEVEIVIDTKRGHFP